MHPAVDRPWAAAETEAARRKADALNELRLRIETHEPLLPREGQHAGRIYAAHVRTAINDYKAIANDLEAADR